VIDKLALATNDALKTEAVKAALTMQGIDPIGSTPQEFSTFIRADIDKWKSIVATMNAQKN
jgi:tripartite-type tricarboxylate transporter receptor subunit TctC